MPPLTHPDRVRYIKLGKGGMWEQACLRDGVNRIGFGTHMPEFFEACQRRDWDALRRLFVEGKRTESTATRFTNEIKDFFEDSGRTLWLTFVGERLYWGFAAEEPPALSEDMNGVTRRIAGGWRYTDAEGKMLSKAGLSGRLTMLTMFRGTSCEVQGSVKDYVVRRIKGEQLPEVKRAEDIKAEMQASAVSLMKLLVPRDFETLVDLVFTTSGWRRVGAVGGTEKTRDLDLVLPSTGERAFVQVKSHTNQTEMEYYAAAMDQELYNRMFFVYHSGEVTNGLTAGVTILGPDELAELVFNAGLVGWLIEKTR